MTYRRSTSTITMAQQPRRQWLARRRGGNSGSGGISVKAASAMWRRQWQRDGGGGVSVAITKRQILASSCEGTEYTDDTKKKF